MLSQESLQPFQTKLFVAFVDHVRSAIRKQQEQVARRIVDALARVTPTWNSAGMEYIWDFGPHLSLSTSASACDEW